MKDEEIVRLYLARSEQALEESQKNYGRYCAAVSRNILGSDEDAEECVNDALRAAWNSIPPAKPENLKTYLGKLTREISVSRWRENHAAKRCAGEFALSLEELEEIADDEDFTAGLDADELAEAISAFLRTLPESGRNIFIRRYWYGDPVSSICERYGFGESKVKVTLKRTRDRLKDYLKKEGLIS